MKNRYSGRLTVAKKGKRRLLSAIFFAKEVSGAGLFHSRGPITSRIERAIDRASKRAAYTTARGYGYMMISFGLLSLILHLSRYYFETNPTVLPATLIVCAAIAIVGIPLALNDKPMCLALQEIKLTDIVLFDFFSIKRMPKEYAVKGINPVLCIFIGTIPAVISYFVPILAVLAVIGGLIFVTLSFISPEFPFLFTILAIPYINLVPYSDFAICLVLLITLASFFRKVMLGKRVYVFGISDLFILLLVAFIVAFGVVGGGIESTRMSLVIAILTLGYIPAANMIVNRRLADCAASAIVISALPSALWSVVDYFIHLANSEILHSSSFMTSPESLAAHLLAAFVFAVYLFKSGSRVTRIFYSVTAVLFLTALFTTSVAPVLIVLPIFLLAVLIVTHTRLPREMLIIIYFIPLAVFFLPPVVLSGFSETFGMGTTLLEMRDALVDSARLFLDNILMGVGADMVSSDGESVVTTNTILGFALRFGVFAALLLLLVFALRLVQATQYSRYVNESSLHRLSSTAMIAMFVLLALGWFADLTLSTEIYFFFFSVFGISTATLRVSKREYDDRLGYFEDNKDIDSSDADITIRT